MNKTPNQTIQIIQRRIGVLDDGQFGPNTAKAFSVFYKLTPIAASHLLGQCYHETQGFTKFREDLTYLTAERITAVFGSKFDTNKNSKIDPAEFIDAQGHVRDPEKLANRVYANWLGNGDEASGDGYKYRGIGGIHLTGKRNISRFADAIRHPELIADPSPIATVYAFDAGLWFFRDNNLFKECTGVSTNTVKRVSNGVNRGNVDAAKDPIGLKERQEATFAFFSWLAT